MNGPCTKCRSFRIVSIDFVIKIFGVNWRTAFEPQDSK